MSKTSCLNVILDEEHQSSSAIWPNERMPASALPPDCGGAERSQAARSDLNVPYRMSCEFAGQERWAPRAQD
ncbi:MAG TPA: hypothetical protein VGE81_04630 [Candidatus Limnocylindrales bacterium]